MAVIVINATLKDCFGGNVSGTTVSVQLCGYGSQVPRVPGTGVIASTLPATVESSSSGAVLFGVLGNDVIQPAGTYYTVQFSDEYGNVIQTNGYVFTGAGPLDLSTQTPINFAPVTPPVVTAQLVRIPWASSVVMQAPAQNIVTFAVLLAGSVGASSFPVTVPGQLVGVYLQQDGVGGHSFSPPPNFVNFQQPASQKNAKTFQAFMTMDDGNLYPFGAVSNN